MSVYTHDEDDDNGPKRKHYDLGQESGEMADILETTLNHEAIFNHGKGQWHRFDPVTGLWLQDKLQDIPKRVDQIAREFADSAALDMSGAVGDAFKAKLALVKTYRRLREGARITAALDSLSQRDGYKTDGSIFDRDPNLLGVQNGVLDLETLKLYRGGEAREMYVSQAVAVAWPEGGNLPEVAMTAKPFMDFLQDILSGDDDVTAYVLRLLGYCLLGTSQEEKFWLAVGPGRNGKGTLLKLMHWLLGDYATFLQPTLYIRGRFGDVGADRAQPELGDLWGKRYGVTSEPVKGEFNEQMLKAHTGRDPIKFRRMRSDTMWTFEPLFKLFFLTQDAPAVEDVGPSMRARARVIQFEQNYDTNGRLDKDLQDKLKLVGQGILVLLAAQAQQYLSGEGLPESDTVLAWSKAYIEKNDPLTEFVAARCEEGDGFRAVPTLVYEAFREWCAVANRDVESQTKFGTMFGKRFEKERTNSTSRHYVGVRLKAAAELAAMDEED